MSLTDAIRIMNEKVPPVPLQENLREPLQTSNHAGFPKVSQVPHAKSKVQSVARELDEGEQPGNDIEPANNPKPITVAAWTPAGTLLLVDARSVDHAQWIEHMNPLPIPTPAVRCGDCQRASVSAGIARCAVGIESGLPITGYWASDRHLYGEYLAAEVRS